MKVIELCEQQKKIMTEFYSLRKQGIFMNKGNREKLWNKTKKKREIK